MESLRVVRAGTVDYRTGWAWQQQLHAARVAGSVGDVALLLEHPAVYTAGRRTDADERPTSGVEVVDVDRGGKITWHGPGQLVGYPVIALPPLGPDAESSATSRDGMVDVVAYVRLLEDSLIGTCARFGVTGARVEGRSGVWVNGGSAKVAAIGVRVARGVTTHGFALNCDPDLTAYDAIVPCGIRDAGVTSLSVLTGHHVGVEDVLPVVVTELARALGRDAIDATLESVGLTSPTVPLPVPADV